MDSVSRPRPPARRTRLPNSLMTCQPCVYVKNRLINLLNFGTLCIFSSEGYTVSKVSLFQTPSWLRSPRDPLRIWKLKRLNCQKRNFTDREPTVTPQLTIALIILLVLTRSVVPMMSHPCICIRNFQYNWSELYPDHPTSRVEFADIGCGYGGLLMQLSPMFPSTLMIGQWNLIKDDN